MWYAAGAVLVIVVAFIWWRITSVGRGARVRDERIMRALQPLGDRLSNGDTVSPQEISTLCGQYHVRPMLYQMLKHFERLDLFPKAFSTWEAQAQGLLAYWMMHPNELQDPPVSMEIVESVVRDVETEQATFVVLKYRMSSGHWSGDDHWHLGLSGPFIADEVPYSGLASAFSRCGDTLDDVTPGELVDWYVGMCEG